MYIVGVYYSWDSEMPMYIFNTEQEAMDFILKDVEEEMRIQVEENQCYPTAIYHYDFAQIRFDNGDIIEWNIGNVKDMR